jgi:hypothetical protein
MRQYEKAIELHEEDKKIAEEVAWYTPSCRV